MSEKQNLSEKLFKPRVVYPETSTLINRVARESEYQAFSALRQRPGWYRTQMPLLWHYRGLPLLDVGSVLARIAACSKKRAYSHWLDTVIGYQSGNWNYEFMGQAAHWQAQAEAMVKSDDNVSRCQQAWFLASQFYSLASFPHYRNDDLATQAQLLGLRAYREMMCYTPYTLKELDFQVEQHTVKGLLHLPKQSSEKPCPVVFLCCRLSDLQIDFYHYFAQFLAPLGIALLTLDAPALGQCKLFNLTQNSSQIHQCVVEQLITQPWIDANNIIVAGQGFGAHIATRLAYLLPHQLRGLVNISPILHALFIDPARQANLSIMDKDLLAGRLGMSGISESQLVAEMKFFSLKNQGLLTRPCRLPVLSLVFEQDNISSKDEAKRLLSSQSHQIIEIKKTALRKNVTIAINQVQNWLTEVIV